MSLDHNILPFLEILLDNAVRLYLTLNKNYFFKTERAAVKKEVSVLWPILKLRQKKIFHFKIRRQKMCFVHYDII